MIYLSIYLNVVFFVLFFTYVHQFYCYLSFHFQDHKYLNSSVKEQQRCERAERVQISVNGVITCWCRILWFLLKFCLNRNMSIPNIKFWEKHKSCCGDLE